ncbi:MAG TPA: phosphodiesterase [Stenotrophobium sp.]|jgi:diguanylate cyclase (GGDEF)-like protein|nr:phosphodiesterase [Stenotrophobium sp.]
MITNLDRLTLRGKLLLMVMLMNGLLLLAALFLAARLFLVAHNYESFRDYTLRFANVSSVTEDLSRLQQDLNRDLRIAAAGNARWPDGASAAIEADLRSLRVRLQLIGQDADSSALVAAGNALSDQLMSELTRTPDDPAARFAALATLADTGFAPLWKLLLQDTRNGITSADSAQAAITHGDITTFQYGLVGIGLALLAGLALSYGIFDSVVRPLGSTHKALLQVLSGNFRGVTLPQRDDEIGAIGRVIEDIKARSEHVHHLAYFDTLTGLPNRLRLARVIADTQRNLGGRRSFGLILIGIERLGAISSGFGSRFGDEVLREIVRRITPRLGRDGTLYRYGGAALACTIRECGNDQEARELADDLCGMLLDEIRQPLEVDGLSIPMNANIGIAFWLQQHDRPDDIQTEAEAALFEARRRGDGLPVVAEVRISEQSRHRLQVASDIRKGIAAQEFEPFFQPVIDIEQGMTVGAETLVRWRRADGSIVMPAEFIAIAEESELIRGITDQMTHKACMHFAQWNREGRHLRLAFNVSARLLQAGFQDIVLSALERSGLPPDMLEMEITETVLIGNHDDAGKLLTRLQEIGLRLSLDDFGTGYSSLSYLSRFKIDKIKLDSDFIKSLSAGDKQRQIVASVIGLAQRLNIDVVAEGVETLEQLEILRGMGCKLMQGWLFAAALPAQEFPHWVDNTRVMLEQMRRPKAVSRL